MSERRTLTLATCCGVHGLQDGLSALLYVLLPILAQLFGLGYAEIGVIRATNRCAMSLFEIPSGMLAERVGERVLLVLGLCCAGLGYLLLSSADGFTGLVLCLFVAGLGAAFQHALASSLIAKTFQVGRRRAALGVYNSAGDVGKLALTGAFTLLIGLGVAWQALTTGIGALTMLAAAVVFVVLGRLGIGRRPAADAATGRAFATLGWGIRDGRGFSALGVIVFLDIAVQAGFLTFLAFLMIEKQVPTSLAAFAVVLTLAGGVFGKFVCGFLAERLGVIRSLVLVECLTAVGIVAVLLAPTLLAYLLLPAIGAALQGSSSITYGTVSDLVDEQRQSRGFAIIYSIATGAAVVAPIGLGLVADRFGLAPAMLVMASAVLLPLPLCPLLGRALRRSPA